jgi:hypothetical protein
MKKLLQLTALLGFGDPGNREPARPRILLDRRVRLVRRLNEFSRWMYDLETRA